MAKLRYVLFLLLIGKLSALIVKGLPPSNYVCPRNDLWAFFNESGSLNSQPYPIPSQVQSAPLCYRVLEPATFEEALVQCHKEHASVFPWDGALANGVNAQSHQKLLELLADNGIPNLWHGFYVKDDRLRQDTFPMANERHWDSRIYRGLFQNSVQLEQTLLGPSGCFQTATNTSDVCEQYFGPMLKRKRSAKVRLKRQVQVVPCVSVKVTSRPCDHRLSFVCVKEAVLTDTVNFKKLEALCEPDEFGSVYSTRCFSFGTGSANYTTARKRCQSLDTQKGRPPRTLYNSHPNIMDGAPFVNSRLADAVLSPLRLEERPLPNQVMAWVERSDTGECLALNLNDAYFRTVSWDCSAHLSFYLCEQPVFFQAAAQPVITAGRSQDVQVSPIPGSGGDVEMFVTLPPTRDLVGQVLPSLLCLYDGSPPLIMGLQTMTLVKSGSPVRVLRPYPFIEGWNELMGEIEVELMNGWTNNILNDTHEIMTQNMTDYYWCEVNDLSTGRIVRSHRVFVRPTGVPIYAVSVLAMSEDWYDPSPLWDSLSRSWNEELHALQDVSFSGGLLRPLRFRAESEASNWTIVDFHFYNTSSVPGRPLPWLDPRKATLRDLQAVTAVVTNGLKKYEILSSFNFDFGSLSVRSIDVCPFTTVYDPVSEKRYEILDTGLGIVYATPEICLASNESFVTLHCKGDKLYGARWSKFVQITGCNFTGTAKTPATNNLSNISKSDINSQTVEIVVQDTKMIVDAIEQFQPMDIVYLADIIQRVVSVGNVSEQTGKMLLHLLDRVTQVNSSVLNDSNRLGNATNRILKALDELGDKIVLNDSPSVRLTSDRSFLQVWNLSQATGDIIVGLELRAAGPQMSGEPAKVLEERDLVILLEGNNTAYGDVDTAIILPAAFVHETQDANRGSDLRLSMAIFADNSLFGLGSLEVGANATVSTADISTHSSNPSSRSANRVLNSKVVSARLTVKGVAVTDLNARVVTTVFRPLADASLGSRAPNSTCVFWDFKGAKGQGAWSTEGCRFLRTLSDRVVCVCDHLTNFAVLLDLYGQEAQALPQSHQLALSVLTIIGLSLSIAGLSITVLSFLLIKKLRQVKPQQVLFNMALAMLFSWVIFLAGFTRVESHGGCVAVAVLLHYFILASFMWMLMEAVLQYLLFVKVMGNNFSHYMLKTSLPAWGLPLIPVIIVLGIDVDLYRGGNQYCWMSLTAFYYAFLAPVALVMAANIVVYVLVVVNICRRGGNVTSSATGRRHVGVRASVACFVVLGLSWVFAFFSIEDARVVFQYLFVVTSSLQGFLIFLIFTARDTAVRAFWWDVFCRRVNKKDGYRSGNTHRSAALSATDPGHNGHNGKKGNLERVSPQNSNTTDSTSDEHESVSRKASPI